MTTMELVAAVKKHARANYTHGWDVIVECSSDADIAQELREAGVATVADAIAIFAELVSLQNGRRDDVMCQSGEHEKCQHCGAWVWVGDGGRCDCGGSEDARTRKAVR